MLPWGSVGPPLGLPWSTAGLPWGFLGSLGAPLGSLGLPWASLGAPLVNRWAPLGLPGLPWGSLGAPLGLPWLTSGLPWGSLGASGTPLELPWGFLWAPPGSLGASWAASPDKMVSLTKHISPCSPTVPAYNLCCQFPFSSFQNALSVPPLGQVSSPGACFQPRHRDSDHFFRLFSLGLPWGSLG